MCRDGGADDDGINAGWGLIHFNLFPLMPYSSLIYTDTTTI